MVQISGSKIINCEPRLMLLSKKTRISSKLKSTDIMKPWSWQTRIFELIAFGFRVWAFDAFLPGLLYLLEIKKNLKLYKVTESIWSL